MAVTAVAPDHTLHPPCGVCAAPATSRGSRHSFEGADPLRWSDPFRWSDPLRWSDRLPIRPRDGAGVPGRRRVSEGPAPVGHAEGAGCRSVVARDRHGPAVRGLFFSPASSRDRVRPPDHDPLQRESFGSARRSISRWTSWDQTPGSNRTQSSEKGLCGPGGREMLHHARPRPPSAPIGCGIAGHRSGASRCRRRARRFRPCPDVRHIAPGPR